MNLKPFDAFKGEELRDCEDAIELAAHARHHTVNVLDPANGLSGNIDVEHDRLNVWTDKDSKVTKFTVG
jgi:hypothetical protein